MKNVLLACCLAGYLAIGSIAHATEGFNIPKEIGTLNFGDAESVRIVVRPGLSAYQNRDSALLLKESYSMQNSSHAKLNAIADLHPGSTGFHLSAGIMKNEEKIRRLSDLAINNSDSMSPYFGLGWALDAGSDKSWLFNIDLGFLYNQLDCSNLSAAQCSAAHESLNADEQNIVNTLESYGLHPVISAGVTFKF